MSRTSSNMLPLGTKASDFTLFDTISEQNLSLSDMKGEKATVIFFICNHCPFVMHVNHEIVRIANKYQPKGVSFIAISSNDIANYPQDAPYLMQQVAKDMKYPFPYLYDESQEVALQFDAACTPDTYVFDEDLELVYRGQIDDSRPESGKPSNGKDLRRALHAILKGKDLTASQKPSIGCNIKWKI